MYLNIQQKFNVHRHSKPIAKGYCQSVASAQETQSRDASSWKDPSIWFMNQETMTDRAGCSLMTQILERCWTILGKAWVNSKVHLKLWLHAGDHTCWQHSYSNSWDYYSFTGMGKISHSNYELAVESLLCMSGHASVYLKAILRTVQFFLCHLQPETCLTIVRL